MTVVVIDDGAVIGKAAIVVEARFRADEETVERRRAISLVGRAVGLKAVDPDLFREETWWENDQHLVNGMAEEFCASLHTSSCNVSDPMFFVWCKSRAVSKEMPLETRPNLQPNHASIVK
jgi:hypothetical protein